MQATASTCRRVIIPVFLVLLGSSLAPVRLRSQEPSARPSADAAVPASITGELTVVTADDFAQHRSERRYQIRDEGTGEWLEVIFEQEPPPSLQSGRRVTLHGRKAGARLVVAGVDRGSAVAASCTPSALPP